MPLWRIFHPPGLYSADEKAAFSAAITKQYRALPEFYVVVIFTEVDESSVFVGGKPRGDFVRIKVDQIARSMGDDLQRKIKWMGMIEKTIEPWIKGKGEAIGGWEVSIDETSRDLWTMNGIIPPMPDTEAEKMWWREGKPVPYEKL